jgi:hypothetical protein
MIWSLSHRFTLPITCRIRQFKKFVKLKLRESWLHVARLCTYPRPLKRFFTDSTVFPPFDGCTSTYQCHRVFHCLNPALPEAWPLHATAPKFSCSADSRTWTFGSSFPNFRWIFSKVIQNFIFLLRPQFWRSLLEIFESFTSVMMISSFV